MATQEEINVIVQENRVWIVNTTSNSKTTSDFPDAALPLGDLDKVRITQSGVSKKAEKQSFDTSGGIKFVERFSAYDGQTSHFVNEGAILNDGLWTAQIGSELWNSRTGITSFTSGNLSINFVTGEITFHFALTSGQQVIIKHN